MSLARDEELAGFSRARFKKKFMVLELDGRLFVANEVVLLALSNLTAKRGR